MGGAWMADRWRVSPALRGQAIAEEGFDPGPRVLGRLLLIGRALIAEKAVVGARVDHHLVIDAGLLQRAADLVDLRGRDQAVLLAEQTQDLALDLSRAPDRRRLAAWALKRGDPAAVEARRRRDVGLARGEIGHV